MRPDSRRWVFLAAGIALLAAAGASMQPLYAAKERFDLAAPPVDEVAAPTQALGLLIAIGRAPFVDYLWLRATKLKEERRYFDALQLSEMICSLQPRFPSVWAFHAWNMAYNISVSLDSAEERWRWIQNGISLLRDRGIPANPTNTQLYRELSWIMFHKIADFMDEQHWYYKNQFALQMEDILGPGNDPDWQALADAPLTWSERVADADVSRLLAELKLHHYDISEPDVLIGLIDQRRDAAAATQPAEPPSWWAVIDGPEWADGIKKAESFWRASRLRQRVKVDPRRVVPLRKVFGPLDFRLAEAHALYWANLGVNYGEMKAVRLDVDKLNTDRIEGYCLQNMYRRGKLILAPEAKLGVPPILLPDTRFIPILRQAFQDKSDRYRYDGSTGPIARDFESAFNTFMRASIICFYEDGDMAQATEYFNWMREHHDHPDFSRGLQAFVMGTLLGRIETMTTYDAIAMVSTHIFRAISLYAYAQDRLAVNHMTLARQLHSQYNSETSSRTTLEPMEKMVGQVYLEARKQFARRPEMLRRIDTAFAAYAPSAATQPAAATP